MRLDIPFYFDPSQSLFIDIQQCREPEANGFSFATTIFTSQVRRNNSSAGASCTFIYCDSTEIVHKAGITLGLTLTHNQNVQITSAYNLCQNYLNPFNPSTSNRYEIPGNSFVKLSVFDMPGMEIVTLVNESQSPGPYEISFESASITRVVNLYKLSTEKFTAINKAFIKINAVISPQTAGYLYILILYYRNKPPELKPKPLNAKT